MLPSTRVVPDRIAAPEYPGHYLPRTVGINGGVRLHRSHIMIAPALFGEHVGFDFRLGSA